MTVSELMKDYTPNPNFSGITTADDWVLAVGINLDEGATENDYTVVQEGIIGVDRQMNPVTKDAQYIRTGQSTTKTGTQVAFSISGERSMGDPFQDYCFGLDIAFGTGQKVIAPYVYFCLLNGKGEKGKISIIVNSDGGGNAGENSAISIDLRSVGVKPTEYTYAAAASV